ncbi:DJ-1/PfpI family protein [Rosettibacter firmus]|uniref:DJ-1/PfpI family protein n=1 Tax=Rosettibacter firmus TaxID=3111522 RepID=UPI00336BD1B5
MVKNSILLILPAQDFNEQEYLVISKALLSDGKKLFIASDTNSLCIGSNNLKVKNDILLYNVHENNFGGIIFIGGKGVRNYWNNKILHTIAKNFNQSNKIIGAICSAPIILAKAGIIKKEATCYPDDKHELEKEGIEFKNEPVVIEKNIITGRDPSAAPEFVSKFLYELSKRS